MAKWFKNSLLPWFDFWLLGTIEDPYEVGESENLEFDVASMQMATEALLDAKKELLSGFRSVSLQGGAFLIVIFGWTLTDESVQRFLADGDDGSLRRTGAALSVVFIGAVLHIVLRSYRDRSQRASYRLEKMGKMPSDIVDCYSIERRHILSTLVLFSLLSIWLAWIIFQV